MRRGNSKYHGRALALAGLVEEWEPERARALMEWGKTENVNVPQAFVEWAALGGERILSNWSNTDSFDFTNPQILTLPEGKQGLVFHHESQGNFEKVVVLDGSDDPPVRFGWLGEPPWTLFTSHFSDCVYAQIFDWQYLADSDERAANFFDQVSFKTAQCVDFLRTRFPETVASRYVVDGYFSTEVRFSPAHDVRLTLLVNEPPVRFPEEGTAHLTITGSGRHIAEVAARIVEGLGPDIVPASFSIPRVAAAELARVINHVGPARLRHMFAETAGLDAAASLIRGHVEGKLEGLFEFEFPREGSQMTVGGKEFGLTIQFRRRNENWWWLQRVVIE